MLMSNSHGNAFSRGLREWRFWSSPLEGNEGRGAPQGASVVVSPPAS
jgi:hypothetical protein